MKPSPRRTGVPSFAASISTLPVSPALHKVNEYLNDQSPDAYEKVVDRLLASDEYAERMTLVWMDTARYQDTSVFHDDGPRDMWPWKTGYSTLTETTSLLTNLPSNNRRRSLPEASCSKIASGFNHSHATTDEGGAIAEEFRVEYVVDRVKTTSNIWLRMTFEYAQCHDHMYDPFSQHEYYRCLPSLTTMPIPACKQGRVTNLPLSNHYPRA